MYRYARRLPWNFLPNSLTRELDQCRSRGQEILDLTNANPTVCLHNYPHAAIAHAFQAVANFQYNPDPLGLESARIAVSRYYASRAIEVLPERLVLTASTSEAYALLFKLFCDPEDEILVPAPSYPLFEYLASLENVRVNQYRLHFDGHWYVDFDHLQRQITPHTRAIVAVNPNNPTGSFLKKTEVEKLFNLAREHALHLISDEVFLDYCFENDPETVRTLIGHDQCLSFSLNGLSKAAGMPQMKLGWIAINGPVRAAAEARERLELISDTYLSVGTPVQVALADLFQVGETIQCDIMEQVRTNLSTALGIVRDGPVQPLRCEGGWSAILRLPATQSEESWTLRLLKECGVLAQPGFFFDMASEPYIVVSLIAPPEQFAEGLTRIHKFSLSQ